MKSWKRPLITLVVLVLALVLALAIALTGRESEGSSSATDHTTQIPYENSFDFQFEADRIDLPSRETAQQIVEGMKASEVYSIMGKPQRDVGSGTVVLEYHLDSGETLLVSFIEDADTRDWIVIHTSIS